MTILLTFLVLGLNLTRENTKQEISALHFEHYCIINNISIQDWTDEDYNKYLDSYCGTDESEEYWEFLNQQYSTKQHFYPLESGPHN